MDQYNTGIFSCCLRLLPLCSSTFHQTNVENAQDRSEDNPIFSRIQWHHLLLELIDHDEEEYSVVLTLRNRQENNLLAQHQSTFFPPMGKVLVDGLARVRLCGFCFGL